MKFSQERRNHSFLCSDEKLGSANEQGEKPSSKWSVYAPGGYPSNLLECRVKLVELLLISVKPCPFKNLLSSVFCDAYVSTVHAHHLKNG